MSCAAAKAPVSPCSEKGNLCVIMLSQSTLPRAIRSSANGHCTEPACQLQPCAHWRRLSVRA